MKIFNYRILMIFLVFFTVACSTKDDVDPDEDLPFFPDFPEQMDIDEIDQQLLEFMEKFDYPGLSIAISKEGELVYRKGYGISEKGSNQKVHIEHQFRYASFAKTLTAIAILKLVDYKSISLNDKVFGPSGLLSYDYGTKVYDSKLTNITVEHLLHHTTGGWRNFVDDPSFYEYGLNTEELMHWALDNVPLAYEPGTKYHYSNFGYLILGKIIEKVSGFSYEHFIKEEILDKVGATQTEISGNSRIEQKNKEVTYYSQNEDDPYGLPVTRNAAPFGWVSTPSDVVRILSSVEGQAGRPPLLEQTTMELRRKPLANSSNYAKGTYVGNHPDLGAIWFHDGNLPGSQSLSFSVEKGFSVSIVMNSMHSKDYYASFNYMAAMLLGILNDPGIAWQDINQF